MELRHLRYFVAVAEELHFRRAAERLHVAQPAVSEQVRKLEAELGVVLLNRTPRNVNLTEAGAAMLVEAKRVLSQAAVAERVARQTDVRAAARLRVGYTPDAVPAALSMALRRFSSSSPAVELALEAGTVPSLVENVREGRLDVAAVCLPAATRGLRTTTIAQESTVVAVPVMHRLADLDAIGVELLGDLPLLVMPRAVNPSFFDGVLAACREAGFSPTLQESAEPRVEHLLLNVGLGKGVALVPGSAAQRYAHPGIRFVPLAEPGPSCLVALVAGPTPVIAVTQLVRLASDFRGSPRPARAVALAGAA
jgi:DNA-binding transcriptional LysR family regulator